MCHFSQGSTLAGRRTPPALAWGGGTRFIVRSGLVLGAASHRRLRASSLHGRAPGARQTTPTPAAAARTAARAPACRSTWAHGGVATSPARTCTSGPTCPAVWACFKTLGQAGAARRRCLPSTSSACSGGAGRAATAPLSCSPTIRGAQASSGDQAPRVRFSVGLTVPVGSSLMGRALAASTWTVLRRAGIGTRLTGTCALFRWVPVGWAWGRDLRGRAWACSTATRWVKA
mmetsp:Transcript_14948/g.36561  ORF Transcript_14948/g.36561 Transcript_14948/m.36561 type:complete len:231 (+) Transcript_14948:771-1463(+)